MREERKGRLEEKKMVLSEDGKGRKSEEGWRRIRKGCQGRRVEKKIVKVEKGNRREGERNVREDGRKRG